MELPKVMWNMTTALEYIRPLQEKAWRCNLHIALAGSVLNHGSSTDDLDIIVMGQNNHKPAEWWRFRDYVQNLGECALKTNEEYEGGPQRDNDIYGLTLSDGRKIDLFFYER